VNGYDSLVITKLDVLDGLPEIPVCVGYRLDGRLLEEMPATPRDLEAIEPVYETLPGWTGNTHGLTRYEELPPGAQDYLHYLASATGFEVGCISTGPERNQTIMVPGSRLEKLLE
jgi:adenylosuccinate synthase